MHTGIERLDVEMCSSGSIASVATIGTVSGAACPTSTHHSHDADLLGMVPSVPLAALNQKQFEVKGGRVPLEQAEVPTFGDASKSDMLSNISWTIGHRAQASIHGDASH